MRFEDVGRHSSSVLARAKPRLRAGMLRLHENAKQFSSSAKGVMVNDGPAIDTECPRRRCSNGRPSLQERTVKQLARIAPLFSRVAQWKG
jgi:hypothetical protein